MQLRRFVQALGLVLVLGVFSSVVGCGSGPQEGALAEQKDTGKARGEAQKALHQQLKQAKSNAPDPSQGRGPKRKGN
jgi:hypothetical protein